MAADSTLSNSFESKGGTQNIGIGDRAIGQQNNSGCINQTLTGNENLLAGRDIHYVEHHHYSTPPPCPPWQLPTPEQCFLHRKDELDWLNDKLMPGKVVAVCGPGGMGKSALAAQAVHRLDKERFPDGLVFHSFYGKPKTEDALQAICKAFGQEPEPPLDTTLRRVLADKKALLFLDGTEQADDLKAVLALHGACGVLITSRKRADAQGIRLDLTPLEKQPAAEVFLRYSGPVDDMASVVGICKILGGWPVALRIAGRYLSTMGESAAAYLKWLEKEPFKELGDGMHQEENAALLLRRSMDAVSADARLALGLAGTLAFASIAYEPVTAILDEDERRARKALGLLVNYGLLLPSDGRWQISHALIHTYARTELALSKESLERLAAWYIAFCKTQSAAGLQGYAILDGERAHCLRLIESCLASKLWQEVQDLAGAMWEYLDRQGYWTDQLTAIGMRLTAAQQADDRKDEVDCLNDLGYTCNRRGDYERALAYFEQSLPIQRELDDRKGEGVTLNNMAEIYRQQGKYELALQTYQQSLSIQREIGDREGEGTTLNNIGLLYDALGDYEQALSYYEKDLAICREGGDKRGEGTTLNNIAAIYRAQGDYTKVVEYLEQALAIAQELGDKNGEANRCWNIGRTHEDLGDLAEAEEYISHAVQIAKDIGHPWLERLRDGLARVQAARQGQ